MAEKAAAHEAAAAATDQERNVALAVAATAVEWKHAEATLQVVEVKRATALGAAAAAAEGERKAALAVEGKHAKAAMQAVSVDAEATLTAAAVAFEVEKRAGVAQMAAASEAPGKEKARLLGAAAEVGMQAKAAGVG